MTYVALPWFVLATTGSTAKLGWVLAAELAPVAIFGIPAGTLIGTLGGKRTMLVCDAARAPLLLVVPLLHRTGHLSFAALLATTFAIGSFSAPYFASSRLVIPEVAGEDEQLVASVGAVFSGVQQITQLAGPVLAGLLIAATSAATALVADGCTYAFSFLTIGLVVRAGRRVESAAQSEGVLAGLRYLLRDPLLGPVMLAASAVNFVAQGIVLGVQGLAYFRYDANAHVLGFLFGGFGVGALLGAIVAQRVTRKLPLLQLAAVAIVAMPLPLFLLAPHTPWPAATLIVAAFAFFTPLVNAPIVGVLTVRTPQELRPKVMTAVLTVATIAGPFGFIAAGYVLRHVALGPFFVALPALLTLGGLAFAAALLRAPAGDVTMPDVAHGQPHAFPEPSST
jgi:MFS family permease